MDPAVSRDDSAPEERRRYYRIDDEVGLVFRVLEGAAVDEALEHFADGSDDPITLAASLASAGNEMHRALEPVKRTLPDVAVYLEGVSTKLDLLARMLVARDAGLPSRPTHAVTLSASGISFRVPTPLAPGSLLEIKLLLFPGHVCLQVLGAVATCTDAPEPGGAEGGPRVGVDFSYIRDSDRELLFKHVVQKQSQRLREMRAREG